MDRELCQIKPSYYGVLSRYKKALLQRNAYLKEPHIDDAVLDIWDMKLAEYGGRIMSMRDDFVKKLSSVSGLIHSGITGGREELQVFYEPGISPEALKSQEKPESGEALKAFNVLEASKGAFPDVQTLQKRFYRELKESGQKDRKIRTTSKGPHKDDLRLQIGDMDIRSFGSQGQQRTAALALKLSEIRLIKEETGESPVLLLDDVLSELDSQRQQYLISSLEDTQIFITATEISPTVENALKQIKYFRIAEGKIRIV